MNYAGKYYLLFTYNNLFIMQVKRHCINLYAFQHLFIYYIGKYIHLFSYLVIDLVIYIFSAIIYLFITQGK